MSFISILKNIATVGLGIEHVAAPVVSAVLPQLSPVVAQVDNLVLKLQSAIVTAEATSPTDNGELKAQSVIAEFNAGFTLTQSVLALKHEKLVYDPAALQEFIDAQVLAYNAAAKLKASFKVVPIQ